MSSSSNSKEKGQSFLSELRIKNASRLIIDNLVEWFLYALVNVYLLRNQRIIFWMMLKEISLMLT